MKSLSTKILLMPQLMKNFVAFFVVFILIPVIKDPTLAAFMMHGTPGQILRFILMPSNGI